MEVRSITLAALTWNDPGEWPLSRVTLKSWPQTFGYSLPPYQVSAWNIITLKIFRQTDTHTKRYSDKVFFFFFPFFSFFFSSFFFFFLLSIGYTWVEYKFVVLFLFCLFVCFLLLYNVCFFHFKRDIICGSTYSSFSINFKAFNLQPLVSDTHHFILRTLGKKCCSMPWKFSRTTILFPLNN